MNLVNLKSKIPAASITALAALAVLLTIAWLEHDAHLRRQGALHEIQKQSAEEISGLRATADAAVRSANQTNARALSELGASRRLLELQSQDLRQKLATLETVERTQVDQVAALPAPDIWKRLNEQLGQGAIVQTESGAGSQESGVRKSESRNQNESITQPVLRSNEAAEGGSTNHTIPPGAAVVLTDEGAREVETSLVQLDSCRRQSSVQSQQLTACQKEGAAEAVVVEQQKSSIAQLNQALGDKDQILARRETEFKTELKSARGTFLGRVGRVAEYVAAGFVLGEVIR